MKGVVSYEVCRLMKEGMHPQRACEKVVFELDEKLKMRRYDSGDISVIAMNHEVEFGAASNIDNFSFVVETKTKSLTVYKTQRKGNTMRHEKASQKWLDDYLKSRMAPLNRP